MLSLSFLMLSFIFCFIYNSYTVEPQRIVTDREIIEALANLRSDIKGLEVGQRGIQKQIDDLKTFMLWGFGILFGGMGILIGFVIWTNRGLSQIYGRSKAES